MGRFERKLDRDLIARIEGGWKPNNDPKPIKRIKPPRPEWTYRGYWRNAWRKPA